MKCVIGALQWKFPRPPLHFNPAPDTWQSWRSTYGMKTWWVYSPNVLAMPGFNICTMTAPSRTTEVTAGASGWASATSSRHTSKSLLLLRCDVTIWARDERSYHFQTPTPLLLRALRPLLLLLKILTLQLRLLLTLRKLPSNSYQKDSVYFASWGKIYVVAILTLIEYKWLKWSREKYNKERHNMLWLRVMA